MRSLGVLLAVCLQAQETTFAERWREDLRVLATEVPRIHPNLFSVISRDQWESAAAGINANIESMAGHEIVVAFARLLAAAGDAHTNLGLTQAAAGFRQFPVRVRWFDDGLFVTHASAAFAGLIGKKVVQIGDLSAEDAYQRIKASISHENDSWARELSGAYLTSPEILHALGILPELGALELRLEGVADEIRIDTTGAASLPHHPPRPGNPLYQRQPALNYWFDYLAESRAFYVKYNRAQPAPGLAFADFLTAASEFASTNPIEWYVFDLRNNTGGSTEVLRPLLNGLADAIRAGVINPANVRVIIGRQTFSSGMRNAIDFKRLGATLVGEPTGGRPNAFGEVQTITLPNSRLIVSVSTRFFTVADFQTPALLPDVPTAFLSSDFFADRDPYLEAAIR